MKHFNVRVYGILIYKGMVLISDEYIKGKHITKFPGGGLEFGEGTLDCVIREFKEELDLNIEVVDHFYTTDFFVASAFSNQSQIISIYYLVKPLSHINVKIASKPFDFGDLKEGAQAFRWLELKNLSESDFTFIIDKHVAELLTQN